MFNENRNFCSSRDGSFGRVASQSKPSDGDRIHPNVTPEATFDWLDYGEQSGMPKLSKVEAVESALEADELFVIDYTRRMIRCSATTTFHLNPS